MLGGMEGRRLRLVRDLDAASAERLLARVARGDQTAFRALFDALSGSVYGMALRMLRDSGLAEDITQDAFLDVWRRAAHYDVARGSARSWVLTIAHRRAVDVIRSREAARARERRSAEAEAVDGPEESVVSADVRREVQKCLDALTPLQRESVELAYFGGCTYRQVAERLDRPLPTIKTRMRDGLIRLRDCLEARHAV